MNRFRLRRGPTRGTLGPDRRRAGRGIACPSGRGHGPCAPRRSPSSSHPPDGRRWRSTPACASVGSWCTAVTCAAMDGAASIASRIERAALCSKAAACSLAAGAVCLGEADACVRRLVWGADLVPESHRFGEGRLRARPRRPRRAAPCLERRRRWPRAPCSRIGRRRAPARRRPIEPGRRRRPRSRSRPAPRAAGRAEGHCSVAAPWRASAAGARGHLGWRRPRSPRLPGPDAPARGPAGDPIRRDEPQCSASSAPAMSPLCSRIRPSSFSGHPSSRRR